MDFFVGVICGVAMDQDSYWVYVLELSDGRRSIGHTNNLQRRLEEYQSGRSPYPRGHKIKGLKNIYFCGNSPPAGGWTKT